MPVLLYNLIILKVLSKTIKKDEEFAEGNYKKIYQNNREIFR